MFRGNHHTIPKYLSHYGHRDGREKGINSVPSIKCLLVLTTRDIVVTKVQVRKLRLREGLPKATLLVSGQVYQLSHSVSTTRLAPYDI